MIKESKTLGLYIHIPFCKTICTYCNFLTFAHRNKWIPDYVDALEKEILSKAVQFTEYKISSVYFGGGTPSLIDAELIERIIRTIKNAFNCSNLKEIDLEANPESVTPEKLQIYQRAGINRLSLGVQSLNAKTLLKVARPHDAKTIFRALDLIKASNWKNFSCDLIMGLPFQTLAEFQEQLETILSYNPTHLSSYFLSYDTKKIDLFIKECPQEEEQIAMYEYFIKRVAEAGFTHYEVSNYALPGYQSGHNQGYWDRHEYLGLGLGAHSFINEIVSENTRDFDSYLKNPLLLEESYPLDKETQRMDYIMLSLRQAKGIDLKEYVTRFGQEKTEKLIKQANKYSSEYLKIDSSAIAPTEKGFLIIDKITRDSL
jgi:oxygen-independent coproporphyrinogen-3 oxidase